jgi:5-methylcytosine-specific restriction endonuclease McrA
LIDREVVEADHIKSMSDYPQLKFNLNNGMSLCANCHRRKTKQEHKERMKKIWNLKKGV